MARGNVFVISAPSGAGKSSLVKELCKIDDKIKVSISHTTRHIRSKEQNGIDYHFVDSKRFKEMLDEGEFLEYAIVYGNYYGTNQKAIEQLINHGYDIILEIDWQGAKQIKQLIPTAVLIYIMPPNLAELEQRLKNRNTDSLEIINKRLAAASEDMSYANLFSYIVINDNFKTTLSKLYSIITDKRNTYIET